MKLRIPAALVVSVIASCGDAKHAVTDAGVDVAVCAIDATTPDAGNCFPCGDLNGGSACNGTCVDPCGNCPPGCVPLV